MIHVLPDNEKHLHDESTTCLCDPSVNMEEDEIIVVHNRINKYRSSDAIIDEDENLMSEKIS